MRKLLLIMAMLACMAIPVSALDLEIPTVPEVRQSGTDNFTQDIMTVLRDAFDRFQPDLRDAASVCLKVLAVVAALAGVLIFGESMGVSTVAGILCILAGVCILR